ncbi:YigZ family protein [Paraglaciecola arctica]|uniref:IMPACT family member in pol 5'region n=1 Tax=Paraglaciecola arctica BSs20135 TaxID=493475 RepID=K6YUE2_9ALTE|nr:YigZ family protein [Paraglaciecola arctica]GAC21782.1 IMPACT family member in pol 5'region [Paraglaciecola arctica BSs20135]
MSTASYKVPAKVHQIELEIKRSKFLTFAAPAADRQVAEDFIRMLREQHPQASHVCWAYIAGAPNTTIRSMSDDGEPSGTAGMPMLKVLEYSGYGDIVVAVVRYFGGTKLGTGGLQRAYSDAVSMVLADLPFTLKVERTSLQFSYDYTHDGSISRLLERYDVESIDANYAQKVTLSIAIASSELSIFKTELTNITSGNAEIFLADED